jgi:hypothetical protein
VLVECLWRYARAFDAPRGYVESQFRDMARHLYQVIHGPLTEGRGFLRVLPPGRTFRDDQHYEDYLLLLCAALMRAMPERGEGPLLEGAFPRPDPEEPPAPKRVRQKRRKPRPQ